MSMVSPETHTPRTLYAPLFVIDRRERFGQVGPDFCSMAPRAARRIPNGGVILPLVHPVDSGRRFRRPGGDEVTRGLSL